MIRSIVHRHEGNEFVATFDQPTIDLERVRLIFWSIQQATDAPFLPDVQNLTAALSRKFNVSPFTWTSVLLVFGTSM